MKDDDPWTFFGTWSHRDKLVVADIFNALNVNFHVTESLADEKSLRHWYAWDPEAENPNMGYHVWVHNDDVHKIGYELREHFPEREYLQD